MECNITTKIVGMVIKDFEQVVKDMIIEKGVDVSNNEELQNRVKWCTYKNDNYIYVDDEIIISWDSSNLIKTDCKNGAISYNIHVKK